MALRGLLFDGGPPRGASAAAAAQVGASHISDIFLFYSCHRLTGHLLFRARSLLVLLCALPSATKLGCLARGRGHGMEV